MNLKKQLLSAAALIELTAALVLAVITIAPTLQSNQWWIRVWDFPRQQILALAIVILIVCATAVARRWPAYALHRAAALVLVGVVATQAIKIYPFTPLHSVEVQLASDSSRDDCVSILVSNVRMSNRDPKPLLSILEREKPKLVLILENDQWWSEKLRPLASSYPHVLDQPQTNTYGLLFMSRLPVTDLKLQFFTDATIPSVSALLTFPMNRQVRFYGVHPKPPRIGRDTDMRDHELITLARLVQREARPSIVSGDLNDVAWSSTTRLFKQISETLDPRIGRGLYSTFHAEHWYMRWPLDHVFHTDHFEISHMKRLRAIGSDHFPLLFDLCLRDSAM